MMNTILFQNKASISNETNDLNDLILARGLILDAKSPESQNRGAQIILELQARNISSIAYTELMLQAKHEV